MRDPALAYALRCSAAFALLANEQDRGVAGADAFPDVRQRGKEFFVQVTARLMDAEGLSRDQVTAEMRRQAQGLQREATLADNPAEHQKAVLTPCLDLMNASLPLPKPQ